MSRKRKEGQPKVSHSPSRSFLRKRAFCRDDNGKAVMVENDG